MMPETVEIRRPTLEDAAALQVNCFGRSTLEAVTAALEADFALVEKGQRVRLIAAANGMAIGNATLIGKAQILERHISSIHDVVVCGIFQGRGIARRLFEHLEARILGLYILETSVRAGTDAEQVYRKLGFEEYERLPKGIREPWGEQQVYDHVYFWKPLE